MISPRSIPRIPLLPAILFPRNSRYALGEINNMLSGSNRALAHSPWAIVLRVLAAVRTKDIKARNSSWRFSSRPFCAAASRIASWLAVLVRDKYMATPVSAFVPSRLASDSPSSISRCEKVLMTAAISAPNFGFLRGTSLSIVTKPYSLLIEDSGCGIYLLQLDIGEKFVNPRLIHHVFGVCMNALSFPHSKQEKMASLIPTSPNCSLSRLPVRFNFGLPQ